MNPILEKLWKMNGLTDDVRQQAALEILSGKTLDRALRHARAEVARQNRPAGFTRLDAEDEEAANLHERLAAPEAQEPERWRLERIDAPTEALLRTLAGGTAALAARLGVTQRRAQQIVAKQIKRRRDGGDLFCGEGT